MRDREFFLRCKSCGEHDVYVEATWTETSTTYYYCSYEPEIDIEEDGTMEVRFDWDDVIGYGSDYAADYESEFGYSDNEMFRCTNCHAECHLVEAGFEVVYMDGEDVVAVGSDDEESKLQKAAVDLAVKIVATQNAGDDLDQLLSEINTIKTGG